MFVSLLVPISEFQHAPLPQSATSQGTCPNSLLFHYFHLRFTFESIKKIGSVPISSCYLCSLALTPYDFHAFNSFFKKMQ
jgi:hypothetical protein